LILSLFYLVSYSQDISKKVLQIERTSQAPKIDGIFNEEIWASAEIATDFVQFEPEIGNLRDNAERTEVKIAYDDQAIYIAAYLYDDPDKIMKQLTARDSFGQADFFLVVLNPNNDSQNDTYFIVLVRGNRPMPLQTHLWEKTTAGAMYGTVLLK
jgi:hypothetical protein